MALPGNEMDGSQTARVLVKKKRVAGRVQEWKGHYGWIIPDKTIEHPEASLNQGRIYVSRQDIDAGSRNPPSLMPGDVVHFLVYADGRGLGAVQCKLQEGAEREAKRPRLQDKAEVVKLKTAARAMNNFTNDGSFLEQMKQMQRENVHVTQSGMSFVTAKYEEQRPASVPPVRPLQRLQPPSRESATAPRPVAARPVITPSVRPPQQSPGIVRPAGRFVPPRITRGTLEEGIRNAPWHQTTGGSGQPPAASSSATSIRPPVRMLRPLRPVAVRFGAASSGEPQQEVNGYAATGNAHGQSYGGYTRHGGRVADASTSLAGRKGFQQHHRSGDDLFDPFEQDEEDPFGTL